jgi:hypothetical protein
MTMTAWCCTAATGSFGFARSRCFMSVCRWMVSRFRFHILYDLGKKSDRVFAVAFLFGAGID